ncbi:hypothetical protein Tco_0949664 [Tanacetum coccineum]
MQAEEQEKLSIEEKSKFETRTEGSSKRAGEDLQQESIKKQKVDEDKETTELHRLIEVLPNKEDVEIDVIPLATKPLSIVDYKIHKEGKKTYYQIIRADGSSKMPEEGYERVLWGDLKTMFDPHVEDQVWRNQQDYRALDWKLYDSCGVHSLRKQNGRIVGIKRLLDDLGVTAAKITSDKNKTEKDNELSQTKRKYSNTSNSIDEQPYKRICKVEKFEAIKYSLGPNEEYITIKRCEYDAGKNERKDLVKEISTNIGGEFTNLEILKCWSLETSRRLFNTNSCSINSTWRIYRANIRGVSHSNSF